jgi:hypothetical protein
LRRELFQVSLSFQFVQQIKQQIRTTIESFNHIRALCGFLFKLHNELNSKSGAQLKSFKEGPLTKNGPIDFAQSWEIHMKKSN